MKTKEYNVLKIGLIFFVVSILSICFVIADATEPTSPQRLTRQEDERFDTTNWAPQQINAEAGNVTKIEIYSLTQTQTWQGYYGEVYGMITLDDAQNHTMYDWYMAEPQGEIYAVMNATVTNWITVHCLNYTNNGTFYNYTYDGGSRSTWTNNTINLTEFEQLLGLNPGDYDGVDETFNETGQIVVARTPTTVTFEDHKEFFVGTINISAGTCPATNTYETHCVNTTASDEDDHYRVNIKGNDSANNFYANWSICAVYLNDSTQMSNSTVWWDGTGSPVNYTGQKFEYKSTVDGNEFQEVLLTVNNSETIIFATIIENDIDDNETAVMGFDNATHDFQMIVGENGHPGGGNQELLTNYYFYVELE